MVASKLLKLQKIKLSIRGRLCVSPYYVLDYARPFVNVTLTPHLSCILQVKEPEP